MQVIAACVCYLRHSSADGGSVVRRVFLYYYYCDTFPLWLLLIGRDQIVTVIPSKRK